MFYYYKISVLPKLKKASLLKKKIKKEEINLPKTSQTLFQLPDNKLHVDLQEIFLRVGIHVLPTN